MNSRKLVIYNFVDEDDKFIDTYSCDKDKVVREMMKKNRVKGNPLAGTGLGLDPSDKEFKVWSHGVDPKAASDPLIMYHLRS